jgi:hypothetical protein
MGKYIHLPCGQCDMGIQWTSVGVSTTVITASISMNIT